MSDYVPDADRSLFAIAEALERIADAQEALVEIARRPAQVPAPAPYPWQPWTGTGYPPPPSSTWIGTVPCAGGSDSSHG